MVSSRRFAAGKFYGINAVGEACGIGGAVDLVVRLDWDRARRAHFRRRDREGIVNLRQPSNLTTGDDISDAPVSDRHHSALSETAFHHMISLERKRTERSRKPFLLMLLNANGGLAKDQKAELLAQTLSLLSACTRETDAAGWYKNDSVVGAMFTEIAAEDRNTIVGTMLGRVSEHLRSNLSHQQFDQVSKSFYLFPDEWLQQIPIPHSLLTLYLDLAKRNGHS